MNKDSDNRIKEILKEIYQIDNGLKQYEADLPNLITALEAKRPAIVIDKQFTDSLRASLLAYKPAPGGVVSPYSNSLFWWFSRLAPVGLALFLLITILPERQTPTNYLDDSIINPEATPSVNDENINQTEMESMSKEANPEGTEIGTRMMKIETASHPLEVVPPLAGKEVTVTSVMMPEAGWLAIYEDNGGNLGELLHSSFLEAGQHFDQTLMLSRELTYPSLITVVIHTGNEREKFVAKNETIQIDPINNSPIMVTVPVISQLEMGAE